MFLEINAFGTVPCITHGDQKIGESSTILTYLCEAFPEQLQSYYGFTLAQRTQIHQYLSWYQASYRPALNAIVILKFVQGLRGGEPVTKKALEKAEKKMCDGFDFMENRLNKGNLYLCGQTLSIADILFFCETTLIELYQFDISKWTHLRAWYDRILENQAIKVIF
jgi:glutathione S-transferase